MKKISLLFLLSCATFFFSTCSKKEEKEDTSGDLDQMVHQEQTFKKPDIFEDKAVVEKEIPIEKGLIILDMQEGSSENLPQLR